ncbi:MAG TPA: transcription elongation factor GreA [Elusimicrobiales bacterium]|nr:transcription elongation factor GreA [Elusimicrobiales bacterium]
MQPVYISREAYERLIGELGELKKRKAELSGEIGEAMAQGDLRENAGYTAAKEKQAEVLRRINELQIKLKSSRITETLQVDKNEARLGATVVIENRASGVKSEYTLVGSEEADFAAGKISVQSPLAQGILGRKQGEEFTVNLPAGPQSFKLLKLSY